MKIKSVQATKIIDTLHYATPDTSYLLRLCDTQPIKQHLIIRNTGWNAQKRSFKMGTQRICIARNGLKECQRLFITTLQERWKAIEINHIMQNSLIAFVSKIKLSKNRESFFCPSQ